MSLDLSGDEILNSPSAYVTGDMKMAWRAAAQDGWIAADGSTIGSATSGAARANPDTLALFMLLWAFDNSVFPIQNADGTIGARGPSASADWISNKRMPTPNMTNRYARGPGTAAPGVKLEGSSVWTDSLGDATLRQASGATAVQNGESVSTFTAAQTYTQSGAVFTASAAGQRFVKVRPDTLVVPHWIKL